MEFEDPSFNSLQSQMRTCYANWKELKRERDALKSSLEKANHKIMELETAIVEYQAKDLTIEKERHLLSQVINTLHKELANKIYDVEQNVSRVSKAIEKLISNLDKTSCLADACSSTNKRHEEDIHLDNGQGVLITSEESTAQFCLDNIDLHVIEVTISDDELSSEHNNELLHCDEKSNPLPSRQELTQSTVNQEGSHDEFFNIFSSSSTSFSTSKKSQSNTESLGNSEAKKSDNSGVLLSDLIGSPSQWFANRNNKHNKSYSLKSSNFTFQSDGALTEVIHPFEEITSHENKSNSLCNNSKCGDLIGSNEDLSIRNTYNSENLSQISATPFKSPSLKTLLEKLVDIEMETVEEKEVVVTESRSDSDFDDDKTINLSCEALSGRYNLSFGNLLGQIRSCYSKWEELKKERDVLKSSLEKANHKIVELETTVARYKAKDLVIEKERFLLSKVINTLHEELVAEGPISKKIDEIEEDVSWLSKALEKSISDLDKRSSSRDANNSHEKEAQINNDQDAVIQNHEKNEQSGIDDVDLHVIVGSDELPSAYPDEKSKSSLLRQALMQPAMNENVNFMEFSNVFSFYSSLFSVSDNPQSKTVSMSNRTPEKTDNCRVFLTDLIASSSQRFANRNADHNKSYSFSKNEIPSSVVAPSSNFSLHSGRGVAEVVRTSEEIGDQNDEPNSSLSDHNECVNVIGSNEDLAIENPDNSENPSQISATSFESAIYTTSEEISHQNKPDSSPSRTNECVDVEGSNEDSAVRNSDRPENPSEINAMPSECDGFNKLAEDFVDVETVEENLITDSRKNSNYDCDETDEIITASCVVRIPHWRYNLRERNLIKTVKYLNNGECSSSNSPDEKYNSSTSFEWKKEEEPIKNKNYLSVVGSTPSDFVDSCPTSGGPPSKSSLNLRICIPDDNISEYRKKCLICVKRNPNNPDPQLFSYRELDQHLLEYHPKPYPVYKRCPYKEKNCVRHFRSRSNLRTHVKLLHQRSTLPLPQENVVYQKKSWLCTFCGEIFTRSVDLKNHVKREHSPLAKTAITCENCKYVANSPKTMAIHKLKRHHTRKLGTRPETQAKKITPEAANEINDKGVISSSSVNQKKYTECVICRKQNLGGMKFLSGKDLDSHISKNHPYPFPDYFPCPRRSDFCNRYFTSIRGLQNHLRGCPPKMKLQR